MILLPTSGDNRNLRLARKVDGDLWSLAGRPVADDGSWVDSRCSRSTGFARTGPGAGPEDEVTDVKRETKLVAKHSSVYAIGSAAQRFGAILLLPLYTSYLTPVDYGVKELIGLTVDVASILISTAISSAIYRFYFEQEDEGYRARVISTSVCFLGLGGLAVVGAVIPVTDRLAGLVLDDPGLGHYMIIAFASLWFRTLAHVGYLWLQAVRRSKTFIIISLSNFFVGIALNVYFIVVEGLGVLGVLLSGLLTSIAVFLALMVPILMRTGLRIDRVLLKEMLIFGWPNVVSALANLVVRLSDRFFIKAYVGIGEAGIYALASRFSAAPNQFISEPFNRTWSPRRFEVAREEGSERVFGRIFTYYLCVISLAGLLVAGLIGDLLRLMSDPSFWSAAALVPVLVVANIVLTFTYHFQIGFLLAKKTQHIARINLISVVLVLVLYWTMIPRWGGMGAAIASLIAFSFKSALIFLFSRSFYRIEFEGWRVLKLLVAVSAGYAAVAFIHVESALVALTVKGMILVATYVVALLMLRFLSRQEWRALGDMIKSGMGFMRLPRSGRT
jgi:O-antigen/teichoic acid export membrane protein